MLITLKAVAGFEFTPFFLLAFVAEGSSLTKTAFCAQVCVAGPVSLLRCSFDKKVQQAP